MSRLRQYILRASLEDETGGEVPVVEDGADSLEAGVAEVLAADQQVVDADQAVEDLGEVQATLESIKVSLESALADGGLTPREAEFFHHSMDASAHRIGLRDNTPSLESFGGSSDRQRTTRIALEGVVEQIKRVWAAIVATLKRWWEKTKEFFYKVFGAAPRLFNRANALVKDATSSSKALDEGATIKTSGIHGELLGGNPVESANELKSVAEDILKTYSTQVTAFAEKEAESLRSVTPEVIAEMAEGKSTFSISNAYPIPGVCTQEGNPHEFGAGDSHAVKTTKPLPGGKVLATIYPKAGLDGKGIEGNKHLIAVVATSRTVLSDTKGHAEAGEKEHAPLNREAVVSIGKAVAEVAALASRYKNTWDAAQKVKNALTAAGEEYSKKDFSKLEGEAASFAAELPRLAAGIGKELDSAQRAFLGYAMSTGAVLVQLGEKSLKHHNDKKKAPEVKPAAPAAPAAA